MIDSKLDHLYHCLHECSQFYNQSLPLCAAENVISEFCKIPLSGDFQERYIMGSHYKYDLNSNFIGSQYLLPFYSMVHEQCQLLFDASYSDARTLTGMNCLTTLLMSLTTPYERIAILPAPWGGHPSVQPVCERLGLTVYQLPYDHVNWDIDYSAANKLLQQEQIKYVLLAPSDIIHPLHVEQFDLKDRILLYDISQLMGLMAGKSINCPIHIENSILFGGTHKTLPGPAAGLILTRNENLHHQIETSINPRYLRHTQMHQVISLLFALFEMESFGSAYADSIIWTSNTLGKILENKGFSVAHTGNLFSETHQLFVLCEKKEMECIAKNAIRFGVTLNKKSKSLFFGTGIRLGTQEIARYGWTEDALQTIGCILAELRNEKPKPEKISLLKAKLPRKEIRYTFSQEVQHQFLSLLHKE